MEHYPAIKHDEELIYAVTWMNFENIRLCERSQAQEAIYCMIPFR